MGSEYNDTKFQTVWWTGGVWYGYIKHFYNIKIDTPEQADAFVSVLESSENDPWNRPDGDETCNVQSDPVVIKSLLEKNKKTRMQ